MTAPQNPYRAPVAAGQTYPPLGFDENGVPRYTYDPPNPDHLIPVELPDETESAAARVTPEPPRRNPTGRTLLGVASVILLVLAVAGILKLMSNSDSPNNDAQRQPPPVSQPLDDPYLSEVPDINSQTRPRPSPSPSRRVPRSSAPVAPGGMKTVEYTVTSEDMAIVDYIDAEGPQTELVDAGQTWTKSVELSAPPRVEVTTLDEHPRATCEIKVDGAVVAHEVMTDRDFGTLICSP